MTLSRLQALAWRSFLQVVTHQILRFSLLRPGPLVVDRLFCSRMAAFRSFRRLATETKLPCRFGAAANQSTHRVSGDNINLKIGHQGPPLIGGLVRWATAHKL